MKKETFPKCYSMIVLAGDDEGADYKMKKHSKPVKHFILCEPSIGVPSYSAGGFQPGEVTLYSELALIWRMLFCLGGSFWKVGMKYERGKIKYIWRGEKKKMMKTGVK